MEFNVRRMEQQAKGLAMKGQEEESERRRQEEESESDDECKLVLAGHVCFPASTPGSESSWFRRADLGPSQFRRACSRIRPCLLVRGHHRFP